MHLLTECGKMQGKHFNLPWACFRLAVCEFRINSGHCALAHISIAKDKHYVPYAALIVKAYGTRAEVII